MSRLTPGLLAAFGLVVGVLIAAHFLGLAKLHSVFDATGDVAHTFQIKASLEQLMTRLVDAESGVRGFVITGNPSYLEPYDSARSRIAADVEHVRVLTRDSPSQQDDLTRLAALVEGKLAQLAEAVERRQRSGFPAAQGAVADGIGKRLMDDMRAIVARMEAREDALLSARTTQANQSYRSALFTRYATSGTALLAVVVLFTVMRRFGAERQRATLGAERLRVTLASIGDAVMTTDDVGRVTRLNAVAESLTGWTEADAIGRRFDEVFVILNEESRQPAPNPVDRVIREGVIAGLANHTLLVTRDGREVPIDDSAAPIRSDDGQVAGVVLIFRDITGRRRVERERAELFTREQRAHAAAQQAATELRQLQTIADAALSILEPDTLIREVLVRVRAALGSDTATMLLLDSSGASLIPAASVGLEEEIGAGIRIPVGEGVAGRIAVTDRALIVDDIQGMNIVSPVLRRHVRSIVGAPLKIDGRLLGVLHAGTASPRAFSEADTRLLSLAADRIAIALNRARLHETERSARHEAETTAEQLRVALEAGQMGTWEFALRSGTVTWSPGLEQIHGYAPGTFPGTFEAFRDEIHPDDRAHVVEAIGEAVAGHRDHHIEYRIVRRDGVVRWVEGRGRLFLDDERQPSRMVGVCLDVTERKKADERFRMAVEAAPAAMLLVNQRGSIVLANAQTETLLGYSRDEIVGQPLDRLVPPRYRDGHATHRLSFFTDARQRPMGVGRDLHAMRKDGTEVPVEIGLSPIETEDGCFVLAAVSDITARKRAEQALRARTRELEQVLDVIPAAVWIAKDPECREIFGNRSASSLYALAQDRNLSQTAPSDRETPRIRHFRNGRELPPGELPLQKAASTGLPQPNQELEVELPDGRRLTMFGGAVPLLDEGGRVRGVVSAFSDISERKQLEVQRAELLAREQGMRAELERASRLKDEFLAVLSHELRTPLSAVLGYAQLLASGRLPKERSAHALSAIQRNAQAQVRLIEALLDLSRIIAGKLELDFTILDANKLVDAAVDVVRPDADAKGIVLSVESPPEEVPFVGDGGRLQQALWNLLSNAIKFTPTGGRIRVRLTRSDAAIRIEVSDTGHGINPDFLPYVFDRFKQGERQERRPATGLGLGLALVREMVQAHGGAVLAESAGEGRGSTFTMTLPLSPGPKPLAATLDTLEGDDAPDILRDVDVLVVDDQADMRDLLALLLASRGATVRTVPSATAALEAMTRRRPDVMLADLLMPGEDGYWLIRTVRAREREQRVLALPAIAVTAHASVADREKALGAGYHSHLAKPIEAKALIGTIARYSKTEKV